MLTFYETDSIKIACWTNSANSEVRKKSLVFIHGSGGNHTLWAHQYGRLHKHYNIAAVNLPGHGPSEGNGQRSIDAYCQWMKKILQALDVKAPVLVGHSLGGAIALGYALHYPKDIAGIVCIGAGLKMPVNSFFLDFLKTNPPILPAEILDLICKLSLAKENREKFFEPLRKSLALARVDVLYGDLLACHEMDLTSEASHITVPVLIVCGDQDKMTPPDLSRALAAKIPRAKLQIIEGAGHTVMLEKPTEFNECLKQFAEDVFGALSD